MAFFNFSFLRKIFCKIKKRGQKFQLKLTTNDIYIKNAGCFLQT